MPPETLTFDNPGAVTFSVDAETRTIRGLALPFGDVAESGGKRWSFAKGSLTWGKVRLLNGHDWSKLHGVAELTETDEGLEMSAKVAPGAGGDELLALADMGALDGLSVGLGADLKATLRDGVYHVNPGGGTVNEVSTTPMPAFERAAIRSVAASATANQKDDTMTDESTVTAEAFSAVQGSVATLTEKVEKLEGFAAPVPNGTAQFTVKEEPIYRFSGTIPAPSGHDFASDMFAAALRGDGEAMARLQKFTGEHLRPATFADQPTTTADTAAVNPSVYRPELFLGQAPTPPTPLYSTFYKGGLGSVTPFFWSKLDRANTDIGVATHTEDVNPESRDLVTASGQTVTPAPVSGRVHITREVADQGGNPQVSGLIWSEFTRSFSMMCEARTAALVNGATVSELGGAIAAGADGRVAGAAVEAGLVGLQFLPDGDGSRFVRAFGHAELYTALAGATKGTSNADKLYPITNPVDSNGTAAEKWASLRIGGWSMFPAASLGAVGTNQKSYVVDPQAVHVWNSPLQRFEKLSETVAGWDLACFAYWAGCVYDASGLRKITFDSTS